MGHCMTKGGGKPSHVLLIHKSGGKTGKRKRRKNTPGRKETIYRLSAILSRGGAALVYKQGTEKKGGINDKLIYRARERKKTGKGASKALPQHSTPLQGLGKINEFLRGERERGKRKAFSYSTARVQEREAL